VDQAARHALAPGQLEAGLEVVEAGVDAAVGDQAHQVERAAVRLGAAAGLHQRVVLEEGAVLDGAVDADQVLVDDPAAAEVGVAHLGVAHLPLGQAHRQAAGLQPGPGELAHQRVHAGRAGGGDGVGVGLGAQAPAIEDHQQERLQLGHAVPPGCASVARCGRRIPAPPGWRLGAGDQVW
jgi:hypothetical protein